MSKPRKKTYTPEELLAMPRSQLLRLAVADMREARKRGYKLDMSTWYEERAGKPCTVCAAGAVLACSLPDSARQAFLNEGIFTPNLWPLLATIDDMREGIFSRADKTDEQAKALDSASFVIKDSYRAERDGGRATDAAYLRAAKILADAGL